MPEPTGLGMVAGVTALDQSRRRRGRAWARGGGAARPSFSPAWLHGALLAVVGASGALTAAITNPLAAQSAAAQDWPPFVLVAGLLLVGLVADDDGLFSAAGRRLAGIARNGAVLYAGSVALVALVTALLNLDTSVAFLTPVVVYTARQRGGRRSPARRRNEDVAAGAKRSCWDSCFVIRSFVI